MNHLFNKWSVPCTLGQVPGEDTENCCLSVIGLLEEVCYLVIGNFEEVCYQKVKHVIDSLIAEALVDRCYKILRFMNNLMNMHVLVSSIDIRVLPELHSIPLCDQLTATYQSQ